jgi:hypothetical protein
VDKFEKLCTASILIGILVILSSTWGRWTDAIYRNFYESKVKVTVNQMLDERNSIQTVEVSPTVDGTPPPRYTKRPAND